jgi:hypothetical protein
VGPDALDIGDLMGGRVRLGAEIWMAAAGASLVEQDRAEPGGIEQVAMCMLGTTSWSSMQEDNRNSAGIAALFHVEPVAVSDAQHQRIEWTLWGTCFAHAAPLFAA